MARVFSFALAAAAIAAAASAAVTAVDAGGAAVAAPATDAMLRDFAASITASIAAMLNSTLGPLNAKFDAKFDGLQGQFDGLNAKVDGLQGQFDGIKGQLDGLEEAALTPVVGARIDTCARATVAFAVTATAAGMRLKQCSAVPLPESLLTSRSPAAAATSHFFLTSAHCFYNASTFFGTALTQVAGVPCALVAQWNYPLTPDSIDLALVRCAAAVPFAPTRLSDRPYTAHARVALVGYSRGAHLDGALTETISGVTYALHTKVTRLATSLQAPASVAGEGPAPPSRGYTEESLLPSLTFAPAAAGDAAPPGFIELSPWEGMSGGAVVDARCGLLGITESRALFAQGGQFVRLTPDVIARVSAAMAAEKEAAAARP